jgi:methionine-rich copper-binding protein CopC
LRARRYAPPLTAVAIVVCAAPAAAAHVEVKSTSPAKGSIAKTTIRAVKVTFTGPILRGTVRVTGPGGRVVSVGSGGRAPGNVNRLRVGLKRSLAEGSYRATWTVTSADGHGEGGSFRFKLRD